MKISKGVFVFVFLLWVSPHMAFLQDCLEIVEAALEATDAACSETGRNQACYGNVQIDVEPQAGFENLVFNQEGDIVDVAALRTLSLSSLTDEDQWGVALMRLQANLPDTVPGQNVTLLLFGNVELANAAPVRVAVTSTGSINLRASPSTQAEVVGGLAVGEIATAIGRLQDSSWLYVQLADGSTAWVFAQLVSGEGDLSTLEVVDPANPTTPYNPMQAFYFSSGVGDAPCTGAPESGILIQTPRGAGEIELSVNEVNITLGSTAFLQAQPSALMTVNLLENRASVSAFDVTRTVIAGTRVHVPLNESRAASGPPSELEPFDAVSMMYLPVANLERLIPIPDPLTPEEIVAMPTQTLVGATIFDDPLGDVVACGTRNSVTDPEVDIVETIVRLLSNALAIEVYMNAPLTQDYSFAVLLVFSVNGTYRLFIWEIHDGVNRIGEVDASTGDMLDAEGQVEIEHNQAMGIISFTFTAPNLPEFDQFNVNSYHTPTRDTQPQPTHCDFTPIFDAADFVLP